VGSSNGYFWMGVCPRERATRSDLRREREITVLVELGGRILENGRKSKPSPLPRLGDKHFQSCFLTFVEPISRLWLGQLRW